MILPSSIVNSSTFRHVGNVIIVRFPCLPSQVAFFIIFFAGFNAGEFAGHDQHGICGGNFCCLEGHELDNIREPYWLLEGWKTRRFVLLDHLSQPRITPEWARANYFHTERSQRQLLVSQGVTSYCKKASLVGTPGITRKSFNLGHYEKWEIWQIFSAYFKYLNQ